MKFPRSTVGRRSLVRQNTPFITTKPVQETRISGKGTRWNGRISYVMKENYVYTKNLGRKIPMLNFFFLGATSDDLSHRSCGSTSSTHSGRGKRWTLTNDPCSTFLFKDLCVSFLIWILCKMITSRPYRKLSESIDKYHRYLMIVWNLNNELIWKINFGLLRSWSVSRYSWITALLSFGEW